MAQDDPGYNPVLTNLNLLGFAAFLGSVVAGVLEVDGRHFDVLCIVLAFLSAVFFTLATIIHLKS